MSDTPETDQEADPIVISSKGCCDIYAVKKKVTISKNLVDADFARKLERERNALKKALLGLVLDFPKPNCGDFHHAKKDRHALHEACPVLRRFNDRMEKLKKMAL